MKFLSLATSALLASTTSARSLWSTSSEVVPTDELPKVPGDNPLYHCADPADDILDLTRVDLDPNPPKAGENLTFTAKGTLSENIEDGAYVQLQIKYGVITIIRQKADLCEAVQNVGLECPLPKDLSSTKEVELPKQIPPGKYTVLADVYTKDDEKITCLSATVEFKRDSGKAEVLFKQGL